jgi:polar amino acid transport system substrate-binding protein
MFKKIFISFFIFSGILFISSISSAEFKAVVPQIPTAEYYVKLFKAMSESSGNNFSIEILPFARSIYLVETKQADIGIQVENPIPKKQAEMKYDYSTKEMFNIIFVLYCNKNKILDVNELKTGNPKNYKIESDIGHVDYFTFQCKGSSSIDASLKKVDNGDIDGFIFSQSSTDVALKKLGLKNINRQNFDSFKSKFIIQKGKKGSDFDKMLSDNIDKIKANGKFQQAIGQYAQTAEKYVDWQP